MEGRELLAFDGRSSCLAAVRMVVMVDREATLLLLLIRVCQRCVK